MSIPLLLTKLFIPPARADLVARPRLTRRLTEAVRRGHKLSLLSAPAGYGKTSLLSEWIDNLRFRSARLGRIDVLRLNEKIVNRQSKIVNHIAWLSLDEADNDPIRFLGYLVAALQQVAPDIGHSVQKIFQAGGPFPAPETLITSLINDLVTYPNPLILILDDYHFIEAEAIHSAVTFLLDYLPPPLHLIIASRTIPPLPLARWRVRGQLTELRAADLRFTSAEISQFLNTGLGLDISSTDVAALEARTEGWIAGLHLAALSLQEQPNPAAFIQSFTGDDRYVLDYLLDEVFSRQPPEIQSFLLQTSILERLCGPLCDTVIGDWRSEIESSNLQSPISNLHSQALLERLEAANLFIIPLDHKREWYRYHALLVDLLRHRLYQASPALIGEIEGGIAGLHRRAAHWFEQQGMVAEAIHHFLAAQDFPQAVRLVEQIAATALWERGEIATWQGWLRHLPSDLVHARPRLCLYAAEALYLTGRFDTIEPFLRSAEVGLREALSALTNGVGISQTEAQHLLSEFAAMQALVAGGRGGLAHAGEAIQLTQQALALLPAEELRLRGLLTIGLAEAYYLNGNVREAAPVYEQTLTLGQASHKPFLVLAGLTRLAEVQRLQGKLHQAAATCRRLDSLSLDPAHSPYIQLAEVQREWNDLTAAQESLLQAIEHGQRETNTRILIPAYVCQAQILQAQGDHTGALEAIRTAARYVPHLTQPWDLPPVAAYEALIHLRSGDLAAAQTWAQSLQLTDDTDFRREVESLIWARVLIAQGRLDEAAALLERLKQAAQSAGRMSRVIESLALLALAHQAQGDAPAVMSTLIHALTLAEPEGFIRLFVDEGQPMAELLERMKAEGGRMKAYVNQLLFAFNTNVETQENKKTNFHPSYPKGTMSLILQPSLVESLTERELEILQLIAQGYSNAEIAHRLVLTIGTVKLHAHHIYGKLAVTNRTQAVAKARELGLLPAA